MITPCITGSHGFASPWLLLRETDTIDERSRNITIKRMVLMEAACLWSIWAVELHWQQMPWPYDAQPQNKKRFEDKEEFLRYMRALKTRSRVGMCLRRLIF